MSIANDSNLPDLSRRAISKLPVLVKKADEIYIYGQKISGTLSYTKLEASKLVDIVFPPVGVDEIKVAKEQITQVVYDEIMLKEGHTYSFVSYRNDYNPENQKTHILDDRISLTKAQERHTHAYNPFSFPDPFEDIQFNITDAMQKLLLQYKQQIEQIDLQLAYPQLLQISSLLPPPIMTMVQSSSQASQQGNREVEHGGYCGCCCSFR